MASLTDKYVNALVAANDAKNAQRKADIQAQYDAWAKRQAVQQIVPTHQEQIAGIKKGESVGRSNNQIPFLRSKKKTDTTSYSPTAPYANDEAAQKAETARQIENDFDKIYQYSQSYTPKTGHVQKSDSKVTMNEDGTVNVDSVKAEAREKQKAQREQNKQKSKTEVVMDEYGLADIDSVKRNARATTAQRQADAQAKSAVKRAKEIQTENGYPRAIYTEDGKLDVAALQNDPTIQQMIATQSISKPNTTTKDTNVSDKINYYANKWLDPSYKMTPQDVKDYEALVDEWAGGDNNKYQLLGMYELMPLAGTSDMKALDDIRRKAYASNAFVTGVGDSFTGLMNFSKMVGKAIGNDAIDAELDREMEEWNRRKANAYTQHKEATTAGDLAGTAAQYAATNALLGAFSGGKLAGESVAKAAKEARDLAKAEGAGKLLQFWEGVRTGIPVLGKNVAKQMIPDLIVDTSSNIAENIGNGADAQTVAEEAAKNIWGNAKLNLLMEGGGALVGDIIGNRKSAKAAKELMDGTAEQTAREATTNAELAQKIAREQYIQNNLANMANVAPERQIAEEVAQTVPARQTVEEVAQNTPLRQTANEVIPTRQTADTVQNGIREEVRDSDISVLKENPVTHDRTPVGNAVHRRIEDTLYDRPKWFSDALDADTTLKDAYNEAFEQWVKEFDLANDGNVNALRAATNDLADIMEQIEKASGNSLNARQNLDEIYELLMHNKMPKKFSGSVLEQKNPILDALDEQSYSNVVFPLDNVRNNIEDALAKNNSAIKKSESLQAKVQEVKDAYDKWYDAVYSGTGDATRAGMDVRNAINRLNTAFKNEGLEQIQRNAKVDMQYSQPGRILAEHAGQESVDLAELLGEGPSGDLSDVFVNEAKNTGNGSFEDALSNATRSVAENVEPEARMTINPTENILPKVNEVEPKPVQQTIPSVNEPRMKTRGTYENTMQKSDVFPEKELAENPHYAEKEFGYLEQPESESLEKAASILESNLEGQKKRFATDVIDLEKAKTVEASDIDSIYMMIRENNEKIAQSLDDVEIAKLRQENGILTQNLARINTNAGQVVQANAKWSRTPEGLRIQSDALVKQKVEETLKNADWGGDITRLEEGITRRIDEMLDSKMWDDLVKSGEANSEQGLNMIRDEVAKEIENAARKVKKNMTQADVDRLAKKIQQKLVASPNIDKIEDQLMSDDIWQMIAGVGDITEEHLETAIKLMDAAKNFNPNSKEASQYMDTAFMILANDIGHGKSFMDKLDAWRYFSMLSKPTTHLRNMLGNATFGFTTGAENNLSALLEAGFDRASKVMRHGKGIERTKSVLGPNDIELVKACAQDFYDNAYGLYKGNKYYDNLASGIEKMQKTFNDKGAGKVANALTEFNTGMLDKEDVLFGQKRYATSLAGYLKANGYGLDALKSEDAEVKRIVEDARTYALQKANEATFHNNSAIAKATTDIDHAMREWSRLDWGHGNGVKKAIGTVGRHVVPFAKTPANILSSILARSPLEGAKVIWDLAQIVKKNPEVGAKQLIEDISKTASGATILGLGMYLYDTGHIELGGETDNERYNKKSRGISYPALKFGDTYVSLSDGNVPTAILAMGANLAQAGKKKGKVDAMLDGLASVSDTIVDTTMLSGIADVLNSARYSKDNADLMSRIGMQVISNGAGQYIPNLTRGIENTIDPEKRNTSYTGQTGALDTLAKTAQYSSTGIPFLQAYAQMAKDSGIPGLEQIGGAIALNPQVDRWGNDIEKVGGNVLGRLANNTINPTTLTRDKSNDLDREVDRLYATLTDDTNGDPLMTVDDAKKLFTYTPNAESKFDGKPLSRDEWYNYQKDRGQSRYELMNSAMNSDLYKSLSDKDKAQLLMDMDAVSKAYTREQYGAEIKDKQMIKKLDAYKENGINGLLQYERGKFDDAKTNEVMEGAGLGTGSSTVNNYVMQSKNPEQTASDISKATEMMKEYGLLEESAENPDKYLLAKYNELGYDGMKDYAECVSLARNAGLIKENSNDIPDAMEEFYQQYGMQGVNDYLDAMETLRKNGLLEENSRTLPKDAREAYDQYGMQGVNDYVAVKTNKKGASYSGYQRMREVIPSLTAKEYNDIFNTYSLPSSEGNYNNKFSQKELIPYLTSRGWENEQQLNEIAHALGPDSEGTWHINGQNQLYYTSSEKWGK